MKRELPHRAVLAGIAVAVSIVSVALGQDDDRPQSPKRVDVSPVVYAVNAPSVRFDHTSHTDLACAACHAAATTSERAQDDLRPAMTTCASCHADRAEPRLEDCAECHVGYPVRSDEPVETPAQWRAVRPAPMIVPARPHNLRFSHRSHAGVATCAGCHGESSSAEPSFPTEESCLTCHDGEPTSPPSDCTTCHPTDPSTGRIVTRREGTELLLRPDNHSVDWIKRHAATAKADGDDCMSCHTETDCMTCHTESVAQPFAVHPPNFLTIHAVDARLSAGNCTDCHTVQTFCTTCHVRAEVTTRIGSSPPPRRQFHPPGWLDGSLPNSHGFAARRDIIECASCHSESDCVSCHAGVNPHPPEFAISCGSLLTANPVSCARCHQDPGVLRQMCR